MNSQAITRANLDGSDIEEIVADSGLIGMTIDPVNDYLYWSADSSRIKRSKLDGSDIATIIEGSGPGQPLRLAVDPATGDIYWMSWGYPAAVVKSNAIGSEIRVVGGAGWPITHEPWGSQGPYAVPFDLQILPGTDHIDWTAQWANPCGNPSPIEIFGLTGMPDSQPGLFKISRSGSEIYWATIKSYGCSTPWVDVDRSSTDGTGGGRVFGTSDFLADFGYYRENKTFYAAAPP